MGGMKLPKRYLLIPGVLAIFGFHFHLIYIDIKERTVAEFNKEQLVLAKTAAQGITAFFNNYKSDLLFLATLPDIMQCTKKGETLMERYFENHKGSIEALTRVDETGTIMATSPVNPSVIGKSILYPAHVQQMVDLHQPVISDVFVAAQD